MLCSKCGNEIKLGEIKCSSCGEYVRIGKGSRAVYHILTVVGTTIVPLICAAFGVLAALSVPGDLNDFKWINGLLLLIPVALAFNIIICNAMRKEEWKKAHDIIKFLPCGIYLIGFTISLISVILASAPVGMIYIFIFFGMCAVQVGMLFIAIKVSKRLKAIKATYDEYYRQRRGKSDYKNLK